MAKLAKIDAKALDKLGITDETRAIKIQSDLEGAKYSVANLEKKETRKNPFPPFTTSTLQMTAVQKFHLTAKATMILAQQLYEMGLITYHRTDSTALAPEAIEMARKIIVDRGKKFHFNRLRKPILARTSQYLQNQSQGRAGSA